MTTLITRLYSSHERASAAASALAANKYPAKHYDVIAAPAGKKGAAKADLAAVQAALADAGVIPKSAAAYAGRIVDGNALLVVRAPVGASFATKKLLEGFESIDAGVRDEVHIPAEVARPVRVRQLKRHVAAAARRHDHVGKILHAGADQIIDAVFLDAQPAAVVGQGAARQAVFIQPVLDARPSAIEQRPPLRRHRQTRHRARSGCKAPGIPCANPSRFQAGY